MYLKHKTTGDCVRIDNLNDWEVVPETVKPPTDRWQDVTVGCGMHDGELYHGAYKVIGNHNYRLRKIRLSRHNVLVGTNVVKNDDGSLRIGYPEEQVWALVVERKKWSSRG